jgi:hypothetical protein
MTGHWTGDCRRGWQPRGGFQNHEHRVVPLPELIAPLCATQVHGQAFFCIPDRPNEANARERVNTAIVTILKEFVTAKQVEDEFTQILPKS